MVLRFVGCLEYGDVKKPININLGGPYKFGFVGDKKTVLHALESNANYIYNLYKDIKIPDPQTKKMKKYDGVSDISAIIGPNGAGKTTSLRIISAVLREDSIVDIKNGGIKVKYVVIQEDTASRKLYISSNVDRLLTKESLAYLEIELKELGYNDGLEILFKDGMSKDKQQVYYSSVFDKSPRFVTSDNLCDISTNYIIDKFLVDSQKSRVDDNKEYRSMSGQKRIDDLRKKEVLDRLGFIDKYGKYENDFLFAFPNIINAFFIEDIDRKDQIYADKRQLYPSLLELKKKVNENLYLLGRERNGTIKEYLAVLILEELILTSFKSTDLNYQEITYRLRYKLDESQERGARQLKNIADKLGIPHEKDLQQKKISYEEQRNEVQETDENYLEYINELIERASDYLESVAGYDGNDLLIAEEFDDLRDLFKVGDGMINSNLADSLDKLMTPFWDGDIPFYVVDEDETKDYLIGYIHELIYGLKDLASAVRSRMAGSRKQSSKSLEQDLVGFEDQEIVSVSQEGKYEEFDEKADFLINVYNLFYETCSKKGYKEAESDFVVTLRNERKIDTECKASFLKFCSLLLDNRDLEYPKGVETFALVADHEPISSGYNGYFDMLTRISSIADMVNQSPRKELLLLLDEAELYLHPKAQRRFVLSLLKIIRKFFKEKDIQIVFASNSPFILSDVQSPNALYLGEYDQTNGFQVKTLDDIGSSFGTNITALLMSNFFMPDGAIGELARIELNELIKRLATDKQYNDMTGEDKKLISIIGDDVIREKLIGAYCERLGITKKQFMGEK